ncbi:hypothetical protein N7539_003010 [Penicillium diatomitis]|uniref:Protein required for cell viability Rrp17 n=1 Tax=Penicillium diatomitis TaxID=2819901 RepID=A0A9X0BZM4_9EURO|nr:uncharacterized protein N7539_003010 [Penicillium diatomitis]KAJ5491443.1 hypothetical protein N7539_003010 [Penicillium diatomitis]
MGPVRKLRKIAKVEEVSFDPADREEFLTGFRKRKQQRIKHAQEIAAKRAKEEKRLDRQKIRAERAAEFQHAIEEHKRQLKLLKAEDTSDNEIGESGSDDESDEEWQGIEEPPAVDYEAEYIDEDKYTTVTVEEIDSSRDGLRKSILGEDVEAENKAKAEKAAKRLAQEEEEAARLAKKRKPTADKPKKKKKQFRYESKQDRKLAAAKQRLSKAKKAKARREK